MVLGAERRRGELALLLRELGKSDFGTKKGKAKI